MDLPSTADDVRPSDLQLDYRGRADAGMIDQTVSITNLSATSAAAPTLSFVALDASGEPLEGVSVTTLFGSDRGQVVVPAAADVFDILRFEGTGADRVEDVEATVEEVRTLGDMGSAYPEVEYLDGAGRPVESTFDAARVRVRNPGAKGYTVRVVGIEWTQPPPGRPQQALGATPLGEAVEVDADSTVEVAIPVRLRERFGSLKAYISTD